LVLYSLYSGLSTVRQLILDLTCLINLLFMGCTMTVNGGDSVVHSVSSFAVTVTDCELQCVKIATRVHLSVKDRVHHFSFSIVSILITVLYRQCFLNYY
jgi:hypothetical protein